MKFFKLSGGLGNQLFVYASALAHSSPNETVILEGYETNRLSETGKPAISELELAKGFILTSNKANFMATRVLDILNNPKTRRTETGSSELGYVGVNSQFFHNNYFQTYKYFASSTRAKHWMRVALGLPTRTSSETAGTAIHVRLGDYLELQDTFGLLSPKYYVEALNKIGLPKGATVQVFSDDPTRAKELMQSSLHDFGAIFREPSINPVFDLREMSTFHNLIICNSSYSYWAGLLGGNKVYAPSKWFRSFNDPRDLIPSHWSLVESRWR